MISTTKQIEKNLELNAPVIAGVSGGKDSSALGLLLNEYLDTIGHTGDRMLIHSDLGRTEWKQSIEQCERLATKTGWPLQVVKRRAGDMIDRWQTRWNNNIHRYEQLKCVKVILPWSTPSMRFCTSDLKRDVICATLKKQFGGQRILNAIGIRREESEGRKRQPIAKLQPKMSRKKDGTVGLDWNAIIELKIGDVVSTHKRFNFPLHEAYTKWDVSRVSCSFCILASKTDLQNSSKCPTNINAFHCQVDLEIDSAFAFKGDQWLADIAPGLLTESQQAGIRKAKQIKAERERIESELPAELLYEKGWPTRVITKNEASLVASVRRKINAVHGFDCNYLDSESVQLRYKELFEAKK